MEIRVFIVSLACLSCLVPPALATSLMVKTAAAGVAKGAAVGVGLGLAAKGAVGLLAKKTLLGILMKAAALKGGALMVKKKAIMGVGGLAVAGLTGMMSSDAARDESSEAEERTTTTSRPLLRDLMSGSARFMQAALRLGEAAKAKSRAVYRAMSAVPRLISPDPLD